MQVWSADAWERLRPEAREFFKGGAPLQGFHLAALAGQAAVQEDYGRLRMLLSEGLLPSRARVPQGPPMPIAAEAWHAGAADRLADVIAGRVRLAGPEGAGQVLILADDLDAVLAGRPVLGAKSIPPAEPKAIVAPSVVDRGGARKRFDDIDFMIEAFRILYDSDVPPNRAEHGRLALEAFAERFPAADTPSAEWAKPLIQRLWNALELERRGTRKAG